MTTLAIIDALFCIPKDARITQASDCIPFSQDLSPLMQAAGIAGAVLAPCLCHQCQNQWNCADRRTQEAVDVVTRNPKQLRGLASYDPLRIGDSLRWIDEAVNAGSLAGVYSQAEGCVSGLDASRMYPLYGLCAKLRAPLVLECSSIERWEHHRKQVEVLAADFPDLDILLATPPRSGADSIIRLLERFPHIGIILGAQDLIAGPVLCEYVEVQGRERVMFRAHPQNWAAAAEVAIGMPLHPEAKHCYLFGNAARLFGFSVPTLS
jgi:predicted TIM-barrel fold metal-dependent hydrolase